MTAAIDLALVSGRVRTLDSSQPSATAVAIAGGRIAAVGDDARIRELCGPRTEVVDLGGAAVVPGLIDSHTHPFHGAMNARGADLLDARTLEDVRDRVAAERARCAPGEWVLGFGLDYNVFAGSDIRGELLADAARGTPALLTFMDFHTALATPAALRAAGVDGARTFAEHAEVVCADGAPTGELRENAAIDLVRGVVPPLTPAQRYETCATQLRRFAAVGITGTHAMNGDLAGLDLLRVLEANGDLAIRIRYPFTLEPEMPEEQWEALAAQGRERGRRWRAGVAKLFIDGVIDSGTAWLFEPDSEGAGLDPFWPDPERYRRAVRFFSERRFQCVTHAIGDRGVYEALNAYRDAPAAAGVRHRIEHIEMPRPADLARFAAEGVVASMQAQHMMWMERSDNWSRRLGPERSARALPIRSLRESGAVVALGSDWPVARYDPREGMAAARLRRPPGHPERPAFDDQAIDGLAALEGYTIAAALTAGDQDRLGRVRAGFCADLTVLGEDPVDCDPDELPADPVLLTVVDGEVVFRGPGLDG